MPRAILAAAIAAAIAVGHADATNKRRIEAGIEECSAKGGAPVIHRAGKIECKVSPAIYTPTH